MIRSFRSAWAGELEAQQEGFMVWGVANEPHRGCFRLPRSDPVTPSESAFRTLLVMVLLLPEEVWSLLASLGLPLSIGTALSPEAATSLASSLVLFSELDPSLLTPWASKFGFDAGLK